MSDGVERWIAELRAKSVESRAAAAQKLATLGEQPAAAAPLVAALGESDEQVREWITAALESIGPPRPADIAALITQLAAERSLQAYWAATLLGRLGPAAVAARSPLAKVATAHADPSVKKRAAWALKQIETA